MTRKLENLDSETLDRISGGCKPVAQTAPKAGPAMKLANKMGSLMDVAVMPASFSAIHEADLPNVDDLIPAAHDLFSDLGVPDVLDSTQLGSGLPDLDLQSLPLGDALGDLPDNWCSTPDLGAWDDMDDDVSPAANVDADDANGHLADADGHLIGDFSPVMGHAVEQQIAAPTVRDHRAVAVAAPDASSTLIRDHRGAASDAASDVHQPIVRDQR
jgi:hypothetical protein